MGVRVALSVPQLGVVEEIIVLEWLKRSGATVVRGDRVVLIETEKAQTELEAPADGTLEIVVAASDIEVLVGAVLAYVMTP
ncbi:MAG: hypothetical protein IIC71_01055 [Acidobacteria bacterium]|nr:hypothetical protein [Acidobacteriota bacterium]